MSDDEDDGVVEIPHLESSSGESEGEDVEGGPSIEELEEMKVVSKRRRRFEKGKKETSVGLRSMYEKRHECGGYGAGCQNEKWIQLVGVDDVPQRMILDFQ
eukprot:347874-Karenia_brevis.AAC.1